MYPRAPPFSCSVCYQTLLCLFCSFYICSAATLQHNNIQQRCFVFAMMAMLAVSAEISSMS